MRHFNFILWAMLMLPALRSVAQVNDAGLWLNISIDKKLNNKFTLSLKQSFRLNENMAELGTALSDLGLEYKISKGFSVSGNYRFSQRRQLDDTYSSRHRYYTDLNYRIKAQPFVVRFRGRYQSQYNDLFSGEQNRAASNYLRGRLSVQYKPAARYLPYISSEWFYPVNDPELRQVDRIRCIAGVEYEWSKKSSFDLFYMYQSERNQKNPLHEFIIGLGYQFKF